MHANLNVTLGPLKYIVATPVFHRWHHTAEGQVNTKNFGGIFSLWDVVFNTFYMPKNILLQAYGVAGVRIPENYFGQLLYPLTTAWGGLKKNSIAKKTSKF